MMSERSIRHCLLFVLLWVPLSLVACNTFYDPSADRPEGQDLQADESDISELDAEDVDKDVADDSLDGDVTDTDSELERCNGAICEAGEQCCDDQCIGVADNLSHCGACGVECGSGEQCVAGLCTCGAFTSDEGAVCTAGLVCCDEDCVEPDSPLCACGDEPSCATGELCCDESCINVNEDDDHCGSCGNTCPAGQHCEDR